MPKRKKKKKKEEKRKVVYVVQQTGNCHSPDRQRVPVHPPETAARVTVMVGDNYHDHLQPSITTLSSCTRLTVTGPSFAKQYSPAKCRTCDDKGARKLAHGPPRLPCPDVRGDVATSTLEPPRYRSVALRSALRLPLTA